MSTTTERLSLLLNTKADIRAALVEKGQEDSAIFSTYADKIRAISSKIFASNDGAGNVTLMMVAPSIKDNDNIIYTDNIVMISSSEEKTYRIYVTDGELFMEEIADTSDVMRDSVLLIDKTSNSRYILYIIDDDLYMEGSTGINGAVWSIALTDTSTAKTYIIYVENGDLMMEEREV